MERPIPETGIIPSLGSGRHFVTAEPRPLLKLGCSIALIPEMAYTCATS